MKTKTRKHKEYFLRIFIFFSIITVAMYIYLRIEERLSNENIIKYVNKEIKITLKEKSINDSISLNLQKLYIPCDSFSIQTVTVEYDRCNCSDTIIVNKFIKNNIVDIIVKKNEYIIYFFNKYITKKGRQFGVVFSYYPYNDELIITQEMFPEFEIIRDKQIPKKKEKWIYIIDNYWAIYVP